MVKCIVNETNWRVTATTTTAAAKARMERVAEIMALAVFGDMM